MSKLNACIDLLSRNSIVNVTLDPRMSNVWVPQQYKKQDVLVLQIGYHLPKAIPDLRVDETGIRATLSFSTGYELCAWPWEAVMQMHGDHVGLHTYWPKGARQLGGENIRTTATIDGQPISFRVESPKQREPFKPRVIKGGREP